MSFGRLLLIALSGFVGLLIFIALFAIVFPVDFPPWLGLSLCALSFVSGGAIAWVAMGRPSLKLTSFDTPDYESLGLLTSRKFKAERAFEVEPFDDEGSHYFIGLDDGRVLFLCGQYLFDYTEITDDPDLAQAAKFPSTEFEVRSHKDEHWTHSVFCRGRYLKPEAKLPHYSKLFLKKFGPPTDGEIFDVSFEEMLTRVRDA
jgi:hypothetical protein